MGYRKYYIYDKNVKYSNIILLLGKRIVRVIKMIQQPKIKKEKVTKLIQCEICHDSSYKKVKIRNFGSKLGIICGDCSYKFSAKEIDLMFNMFTAFGGFFGKLQPIKLTNYLKLKEIAKEYLDAGKDINNIERDVLVLHKAFLHGISLSQLKQGLKLIMT